MEERVRAIHDSLVDEHGQPDPPSDRDPVVALVGTVLSQNTSDTNRDKALETLEDRIGLEPAAIHAADRAALEDAIRPAGLAGQKAERIHALLDALVEETGGAYTLSFLDEASTNEAVDWLTSVPGIGPKTAAVELCFRFDKPVFAVDTHCHRLAQRFGLVEHGVTRRATHREMNRIVPDELTYSLHRLMIAHGRRVCSARNPSCDASPTCRRFCSYHEQVIDGDVDPGDYPVEEEE